MHITVINALIRNSIFADKKEMIKTYSNRRYLLLAILSGILFAMSWPARGFPFLIFFAFIPLFIIEDSLSEKKEHNSPFRFFIYSYITFIIWNGLTTYWIIFSTITGALLAIFINSLLMTLPIFLMHLLKRNIHIQNSLLTFIFFWVSFEFLHMNWDLSWSWLNLGNAFSSIHQWIQWYEYTGVLGGTVWILLINALLYYVFKILTRNNIKSRIKKFIVISTIIVFAIPSITSFVIYYTYKENHDPAEIVIVQPNFDSYESASTHEEISLRIDLMLGSAEKKITPSTKFVIFPEGVLPEQININIPENFYSINRINDFLADYDSLYLITGVMGYKFYEGKSEASPTARQFKDTPNYYDIYNAALITHKEGGYHFYSKSKLVPGVERMPFFWLFKPLEGLIRKLGGIPGSMGYWEDQKPYITRDSTKIHTPVCYESIYGEFVSRFVLQNSELILIITNDGWWRDTPGYRQHNQYARLRAVETRRSIARAATTGISSFINQRGDIIESSRYNEMIVLRNNLNKNQKITFYTINGDYIGRFAVLISILNILYLIVYKFLTKRKNYLS